MIQVHILFNGTSEPLEVNNSVQQIVIDLQKFVDSRDLEIRPKRKPSEDKVRELEEQRTELRRATGESDKDHIRKAKQAVVRYWNGGVEKYGDNPITEDDVYVVWFAFALGNWKCLISSDAWTDTSYFEVSYNGAKNETYVDHYHKVNNKSYPDE